MTLGELIEVLEAEDPNKVLRHGFLNTTSYRGYYDQLAFEPEDTVSVLQILNEARAAVGRTFMGYKGGDYKMGLHTDVWLAEYGDTGEMLGPMLLRYMLTDTVPGTNKVEGFELNEAGRWQKAAPPQQNLRADGSPPQDGDIYVMRGGKWVAEPLEWEVLDIMRRVEAKKWPIR